MDVCINSLLPKGKKILIINNGTYSMRAVEICEYYNLPFVNFDCPIDEIPDLNQVEQILKENQDIALAKNQNGKDIQRCLRRYTQDLINSASRTLSGGNYRQVLALQ